MANVNIEGHGSFTVDPSKVQELLQWLTSNGGVKVEGTDKSFKGKTLLNEQQPPDGARIGNPTPREGKDYDFGGTWM
jgi:hypothetical protein